MIGFINKIKKFKYFIIFVLIFLMCIIFLSQLIFKIEIITNDHKMEKLIRKELKNNGLSPYKFKKNYHQLQIIKKHIINKYKHDIDWIEIENIGSKYIVRYEPRIENKESKQLPFRHLIAKKNAIIHSMDINTGEVVKRKHNYVSKGEVIVSGYIHLNDKIVSTVSSKGKVMGEVWYSLDISYPLKQYYEKRTGRKNKLYVFKILNKNIEIFNLKKYKTKQIKRKVIFKNSILPITLEKQIQYQTKVINKKYSEQEALKRSIKLGKKKLKKKVINYKVLNKKVDQGQLKSKIFYTVLEDITDYQTIEEYKDDIDS